MTWPDDPDPSLKNLVQRLRNAISHGNIEFVIPKIDDRKKMLDLITIKFHDERRNGSNKIDAEFSLKQLMEFNKQFQHVIHEDVKAKHGITSEEMEKNNRRFPKT